MILDEDENGDTPLHQAAANGYYLTVKELLKSNADCDARLVGGCSNFSMLRV